MAGEEGRGAMITPEELIPFVVPIVRRLLGADHEDAVGEIALKVVRAGIWTPSYISTIARNHCYVVLRQRNRDQRKQAGAREVARRKSL